jgi:NAD(P)-dependent dehydrogenase (short-subunit alcohol dehydrogenase family)
MKSADPLPEMNEKPVTAIIVSVSSDIGTAMARRWVLCNRQICGTYRTWTPAMASLSEAGVSLVPCDLARDESVTRACREILSRCPSWDLLVLCPGTLDPVGPFERVDFDGWASSIQVNFTNQLRFVRELLPQRNRENELGPCVLFFAGGGTNSATVNYSAYTASKIALIKMCELLDAEIKDTRFTILGPGWVNTKIHESTLKAGDNAGDNLKQTADRYARHAFTPMQEVLDCCDWLIQSPRELIGGRNFSVAFDAWGTDALREKLVAEPDMYKLRRHGNQFLLQGGKQ